MTAVLSERASAIAAGLVADRVLGEPPSSVHPVARFGSSMQKLETRLYADSRPRGIAYAGVGAVSAAVLGRLADAGGRRVAWTALSTATYTTVASRALVQSAEAVAEQLAQGRIEEARSLLPALVGREPSKLDREEICRAVVESVAENTVDAVVAPIFWAAAFGSPAVLAYRAINTLDAMVGHRSSRYLRFGWAAARTDDIANWVPARLAAILVMVARPSRAGAVWRAVRAQAPYHPSPNAGVAEAAFAAALGIRLGGTNTYGERTEQRPSLGHGPAADVADIEKANRLSLDVMRILFILLLVPSVVQRVCGQRGEVRNP